jgi:hypothetical protein
MLYAIGRGAGCTNGRLPMVGRADWTGAICGLETTGAPQIRGNATETVIHCEFTLLQD